MGQRSKSGNSKVAKPASRLRKKAAGSKTRGPSRQVQLEAQIGELSKTLDQRTRELNEALEHQTATSEVLSVISRAASDLDVVLESIASSAVRLCRADYAHIYRLASDGNYYLTIAKGIEEDYSKPLLGKPFAPGRGNLASRAALEGRTVHIPNIAEDPEYTLRIAKQRTGLAVPLMRAKAPIGVIVLLRTVVNPFSDRQIDLVSTFAEQAVIAIENARLFNELQVRTDDLAESLQQQTATADVLKIISRSTFDLETVLNTLLESAAHLCEGHISWIFQRDGEILRWAASYGLTPEVHTRVKEYFMPREVPIDRGSVVGRTAMEAAVVQISDVLADPEYKWQDAQRIGGYRACIGVPLVGGGRVVGVLFVAKTVPQPFSEKQVELVTTFADQAVIAIENTRLVNELRESLQQQTATADVLKAISRSTFDLQTVLDTLTESAALLCDAEMACIVRPKGDAYYWVTNYGFPPEFYDYMQNFPMTPGRGTGVGRALLESRTIHIADVLVDPEYNNKEAVELGGIRTVLAVPLLRDGAPIGVIILTRSKVQPFSDKQIELVTTFADQAVIAIENVRLFTELEARTRELSQSVGELQALGEISQAVSSTLDLETVLTTIVHRAVQLSGGNSGIIYEFEEEGQVFKAKATHKISQEHLKVLRASPIRFGEGAVGRAGVTQKPVEVTDITGSGRHVAPQVRDILLRENVGSLVAVPLVREGRVFGGLVILRRELGTFPSEVVSTLQTFAAQSVLALQNARLFENVEARTRELAESLEDLRKTQDRLVQTEKLASLGQLTAGIAHEIKNPLNFVNNFSSVSRELIDELREALGKPLDDRLRGEVDELAAMLQGNLDKIVQHGKRADSIVKNMLLHSRTGSGEHRPVNINNVVEESLNLAYHGARAEGKDFNITLERSFDPAAGEVDLYPQEITRVLLNLIANGFYAATKRKEQSKDGSYQPTLTAATKDLGDRVEIRIRDNGTGMPPEVRNKLFSPFFTTKPAGEGTGLGLSLSHDIIVKQHAGTVEVETEPNAFTEFRIVLPRNAAALGTPGEIS